MIADAVIAARYAADAIRCHAAISPCLRQLIRRVDACARPTITLMIFHADAASAPCARAGFAATSLFAMPLLIVHNMRVTLLLIIAAFSLRLPWLS